MAHVLVADGEQRSALAIVRSLGRAGHFVSVCSSLPGPLAGASRFCRRAHLVADASGSQEAFAADVLDVVRNHAVDVLVPATDSSGVALLGLPERYPALRLAFPSASAYLAVSDKRGLWEMARALGVAVPEQVVIEQPGTDTSPVEQWARELDHEVVVKPSRSAVQRKAGLQRLAVAMIRGPDELARALASYPSEAYPLLVQRRISGPGLGAFLLCQEGRVLAAFAHRRIREKPPTGGVSVYRESVPLRADVRAAAEAILGQYRWTGVAMVEFKEEAATDIPYLMEVNGRFWGSLQLAIDAGVDFPAMLLSMTLGEPVAPATSYQIGIRSRWLWGDVDHLLWVLRRSGGYRAAFPELPSIARALGSFLVPWRPGDRFEVLRLSDPAPFIRESIQWVSSALHPGR
jgi:predicted ATP-grasp superfamily ATP-dependent carboligase